MNWKYYWQVKKQHKPKKLCSQFDLTHIDSFDMFRHQELVQFVRDSKDRISLIIPEYNLTAFLRDDDSLLVEFDKGSYIIPVEAKKPNFGGVYYFFHCPLCNNRMRKLYCLKGQYQCRKCAGLGYWTQRLRPSERHVRKTIAIKNQLVSRCGSLQERPLRMQSHTFQKQRIKYVKHDESWDRAYIKELTLWYGNKIYEDVDLYFAPSDLMDAYVERE